MNLLRKYPGCRALALLLAVWVGVAAARVAAETAENFFAGKTVTYIVATKPGGGYDQYARLIAEFMEKHIDGVRIHVQNIPGAGHIVGANQLSVAAADGLTIGTFNTGLIYAQLIERSGVRFDLNGFDWIGKAASDPRVFVIGNRSGIDSIDGLRDRADPILMPTAGIGSAAHAEILLLSRALGFEVTVVPGFGGNEAEMSVLRGELDGLYGSYSSLRPFVENRNGAFLFYIGDADGVLEDLPPALDLTMDDGGRKVVAAIETIASLARLTAAPGGVPPDRLEILRKAYRNALADPDLRARAAELKLPIDSMRGVDVATRIRSLLDEESEIRAIISSAFGRMEVE